MIRKIIPLFAALMISAFPLFSQDDGQPKQPTLEELIQQEVERLEKVLKLEDWQVFYVDSTLTHNFREQGKEMEALQRARVENSSIYLNVQDKWMMKTEAAFKKYFTQKQWEDYLRQGGDKIIRDREKRQKQALEATNGKQAKKKKK